MRYYYLNKIKISIEISAKQAGTKHSTSIAYRKVTQRTHKISTALYDDVATKRLQFSCNQVCDDRICGIIGVNCRASRLMWCREWPQRKS